MNISYKILKRIIDIIGSIIGLIILLPFFPFIALAIKLDSFFRLPMSPTSEDPDLRGPRHCSSSDLGGQNMVFRSRRSKIDYARHCERRRSNLLGLPMSQILSPSSDIGSPKIGSSSSLRAKRSNLLQLLDCHGLKSPRNDGKLEKPGMTERLFRMTNSPVLIKLNRVSEGKIIGVYKFRSMVENAQNQKRDLLKLNERKDGPFFKIKNDPRITKVGKFLRKTRIDEIPQLINVLKGELSLVGPRPHEPEELYAYPSEYRTLLSAKTGITGLSQVNGASSLPFLKELELDKYYLDNQSFWLDLKILFKTLFIFFTDPTGV